MAYTYLEITNEVIARFNEVALTANNFSTARGFQTQCKNAVNDAIDYINTSEYNWPFNHATKSNTLVSGTTRYALDATAKHVDYDTFRISKNATLGASGGNLTILDYKDYLNKHVSQEDESNVGAVPRYVFRTPDNKFGLYPYPDAGYILKYEYYTFTTKLDAHGNAPVIPEQYRSVIVDGATAFGYQYRGEVGQYQLNFKRFEDGIKHMRSLLINRTDYLRSTALHHSSANTFL
jgi:hypothetical protein|tara:strand:- start:580 stop:1284 length:705 start_codon:yes stop_codon:yes gene_type:complete